MRNMVKFRKIFQGDTKFCNRDNSLFFSKPRQNKNIIFYANNFNDMPVLLKPTDLNQLLFTEYYPRSYEPEKHLG